MLWPRTVSTEAEPPIHVGRRATTQKPMVTAKIAIEAIRRHGIRDRVRLRGRSTDGRVGETGGGAATAVGRSARRRGRFSGSMATTSAASTSAAG